jgi:sec-independent protein translocase protein TatA
MGDLLQPWHLVVLGVVVFLLFGARRLPELGKGLGEGLKGFREGIKGITEPYGQAPTVQQSAAPAQASVSSPMEYIVCTRCGGRFENPNGFKVADFVCRGCQARS